MTVSNRDGRRTRLGTRLAVLAVALAAASCAGDDNVVEPSSTGTLTATSTTVTTTSDAPSASATTATTSTGATTTEPTLPTEPTVTAPRSYDFSEVSPIVEAFVTERGLDGAGLVVVDRDDGIVYEDYWGEFGPERVSLVASSSKMIVAGVLLRLDELGVLDLDQPIADLTGWRPEDPSTATAAVTIAQLLSNSSGFVGLGPTALYGPYTCQFDVNDDLERCGEAIFTTAADDRDVIAPDTEFRYGGGQWQVAGAVAEAVTGSSWDELVAATYVEPCGVDSLGFTNQWAQFGPLTFEYPDDVDGDPATLAPTANPNMEGGAYLTALDYAELLLMQLRAGRCGETRALSAESVERMHTDRVIERYGPTGNPGLAGYGLGWWVRSPADGYVTDPGAYGTVPWLELADGYGVYLVVEEDLFVGVALADEIREPIDRAHAAAR
jgi:CubicO group peptidase (beta-lactamase class C family)